MTSKIDCSTLKVALLLATCIYGCMSPLFSVGQSAATSSSIVTGTEYPNTEEGLRLFLEDIRSAAMRNEKQKVANLVKQTEIPDYQNWFRKTYPTDKAESWSKPYGEELKRNQDNLLLLFTRLSQADGRFIVRKVSDKPEATNGLEADLLHAAQTPLDIYFASWKSESPHDRHTEGIGYFIFIDGMFRWDSVVYPIIPKFEKAVLTPTKGCPTTGAAFSGPVYHVGSGVTPPKLISMPELQYTKEAKKLHIEGAVLLSAIIDVDGRPKNIEVVRSLEAGLDEEAKAVFSCAKFESARFSDKPVPVKISIEQNFYLYGR